LAGLTTFTHGRLKHCCSTITDGTHFSPEVREEGRPYVTVRDIEAGSVNVDGASRISDDDFLRLEREGCRPKIGDVLFSKDGTIGKVALCDRDDFVILSSLALLRPGKPLSGSFLRHAVESPEILSQVEAQMAGAALRRITLDKIVNLTIPIPALLGQQERIANFLDEHTARIDALIAEKERLLQSLSDYQYSYASALMTRGLEVNVEVANTSFPEIGAIPKHWKVKRLKFLGEVRSGVAKGKDLGGRHVVSLPYLRVANVQAGYVDLTEVLDIEVPQSEADRYLLEPDDVLMNEGGDNDKLGRGTVWQGQIAPCIHQNHVFAVRLFDKTLAEWVARFTSTDAARAYFFLRSKQSTNLASINQSNVREFPVPVPPENERLAIIEELRRSADSTNMLIEHTGEHITRLREYRSSLISAAVTGQLNIDDFKREAA
jgi:type I restriction enzyme S subunit